MPEASQSQAGGFHREAAGLRGCGAAGGRTAGGRTQVQTTPRGEGCTPGSRREGQAEDQSRPLFAAIGHKVVLLEEWTGLQRVREALTTVTKIINIDSVLHITDKSWYLKVYVSYIQYIDIDNVRY